MVTPKDELDAGEKRFKHDMKNELKTVDNKQQVLDVFQSWAGIHARPTSKQIRWVANMNIKGNKTGIIFRDVVFMRNGRQQSRKRDVVTGRWSK